MYYPYSENKGADQLLGYREADLRLCFRICKIPVFSRRGSIVFYLDLASLRDNMTTGTFCLKLSFNHNTIFQEKMLKLPVSRMHAAVDLFKPHVYIYSCQMKTHQFSNALSCGITKAAHTCHVSIMFLFRTNAKFLHNISIQVTPLTHDLLNVSIQITFIAYWRYTKIFRSFSFVCQ